MKGKTLKKCISVLMQTLVQVNNANASMTGLLTQQSIIDHRHLVSGLESNGYRTGQQKQFMLRELKKVSLRLSLLRKLLRMSRVSLLIC